MFCRAFLILNGFWLGSIFMQPNRHLTVCTGRSTSPMGRWLLAGAYMISMLYRLHCCCILLSFMHLAWSSLMFLGTACWVMYLFENFFMFGPFAFETNFRVGNFEKRSMQAKKKTSLPCPSNIGPPKSNWISSFGSEHGGRGVQSDFRIKPFRFLPN